MKKLLSIIGCCIALGGFAQSVQLLDSSQSKTSYRGLSVVSNQVAWVSGSKGTIGKTLDGGKTWEWLHPKGFEKRDFRDIEAFDEYKAVAMAVDSPGTILKTVDGGHSWQMVYQSHVPGMFLDAMAFLGDSGVCIGDPINGRFWMIVTQNGGTTWKEVPFNQRPIADAGEACFAASGTNIILIKEVTTLLSAFVTGGKKSRLHITELNTGENMNNMLAITQGQTMTGANSVIWFNDGFLVAGGNYNQPQVSDSNLVVMAPGWPTPDAPVPAFNGYASCIAAMHDGRLIACGVPGVSISAGSAKFRAGTRPQWKSISPTTYHVVQKAKTGDAIFLAGANGKIGRLVP
ncbi:MAG TPA: hypothetical protein VLC98_01730 [Phnomibacter sp.]|nr:hypothetical protein [Phnomibacter sp.]